MAPVQSKPQPNVARSDQDPSAIVGLACRVPGASSPSKLWTLLEEQRDVQKKMPVERFNVDAFYHPDGANKGTASLPSHPRSVPPVSDLADRLVQMNAKYGYFLDQDISQFDAGFFNISGKEAEAMDPQQRLLLEVVYEALEDAGITLEEINGSQTSVFCGCFTNDYNAMVTKDLEYYPKYTVTGTGNSILANRISYFYNLHGASATIDTACSSSLVGLHMGNQTLRTRECDLSIVIGSALHFDPNIFITMTDLGMLSTDGRCRAFDAAGRGYVRGEGICAAVLKRSADAHVDGNIIRAIVRGTHVNHDGTKQGITMPNPQAHEALIRRAYADAGLDPADTQYFEAHGTGTPAGDPRETRAIGAVFSPNRTQPLVVGSVKTNIGHLEGASGLAALIKATLSLERGKIPANMHFNNPNPSIAFDDWKIKVPTKMMDWPTTTGPKRASVNSFGYGGTNAHVILEAYETPETDSKSEAGSDWSIIDNSKDRPILTPLTSHSKKAGTLLVKSLVDYLGSHPATNVVDFAHSLGAKRTMHKFRSFAIGKDLSEIVEDLSNPKPVAAWGPTMEAEVKPRIGFVFTGQGGQWFAMGRQLIEQSVFFKQTLEKCDAVLQALPDRPDWSVVGKSTGYELLRTKETSRLGDTRFSQPICTALQLALVDLLAQWGIEPSAAVGHSSGEMAAAYAAGIFSFENTIVTAYYRGVYMSNASSDATTIPGAMMAVGMTEPEAVAELKPFAGRLSIAAINGPSSITLSGDKSAIFELKEILVARKVFARELQVTQAFHSHHMLPLAPGYKKALEKHENFMTRPAVHRMVSSVTARVADSDNMGPDYWTANMVGTVKFSDALTGILLDDLDEKNVDVLVEVGPHPALKGPARQVMSSLKVEVPYLASLTRGVPDYVSLLTTAGQLFALGYPVDLAAVNSDIFKSSDGTVSKINSGNRLKDLPSYSWDHAKYWSETRVIKEHRLRESRHTLLGARVAGSSETHPRWRNFLRKAEIPWLSDHQIEGKVIFPAAGYITVAVEALVRLEAEAGNIKQILIRDVMIKAALALTDKDMGTEILLELRPLPVSSKGTSGTWHEFVLFSYDDNERCVENCRGLIALEKGSPAPVERIEPFQSFQELQKTTNRSIPVQKYYDHLWSLGLQYGHSFKLISGDVETGPGFAIAPLSFLNKDHLAEHADACVLHPTLLDASFHTLFGAIEASLGRSLDGTFVPTFCRSLKLSGSFASAETDIAEQNFYVCSDAGLPSSRVAVANLRIHSQTSNQLLIDMQGLECTALGDSSSSVGSGRSLFFRIRWQPAFDLLGDWATSLPSDNISDIMDIFAHQHPDAKILHLTSNPEATRKLLRHLGGNSQERRRFGRLTIFSFLDFMPERFETIEKERPGLIEFGRPSGEDYDLIVVGEGTFTDVKLFLKPEGFIIRDNVNLEVENMATVLDTSRISAWRKHFPSALPQGPIGLLMASNASKNTHAVASRIEEAFHGLVYRTSFDEVAKGNVAMSENIVVLASLDEDIFFDTTSDHSPTFEVVKKMLTEGKRNIVWALQGATMNSPKPEQAIIVGLARTARSENEHLRFVTFDIDQSFDSDHLSRRILQFLDSQIREDELTERDGRIFIPRIEADDSLNSKLTNGVGHEAKLEPFNQPGTLALEIQKVGLIESLAYRSDEGIVNSDLAADEVEIEVYASAIGSRDIAICTGAVVATALGDECAGVIVRKGKKIGDDDFRLGDRVMAWTPGRGAHRRVVRSPASLCHRLGDTSFEVAAALPIALTTAFYALREVARLQKGETVLIHSAGSATGQVAVQLAQHIGASIIATAGSQNERRFIRDTLSVNDDQIISNRDSSFVQAVMRLTHNKGVDVVMNSLTGELLHATWNCVAPFGRFIETGTRDINENTRIEMEPFRNNITFASVNMVRMYEYQRPLAARLLKECCQLLRDGIIRPLQPIVAFPYSEAAEAFSVAHSSETPNKIVLQRSKDDMVPVLPSTYKNLPLFDPKKIYLLVGGLGGLGRTLAEWMVRRGARRLAFLSRSGARRPEASSTLEWLKARQVQTSVYCGDISGYATVRSCIESVGSDLAGIFQAAMILQDTPFERMSYQLWQTSLRPKVAGTYNLHKATLKSKLDFFVCFSSCSAMVGAKAQANYSAANTFLDALMRNRRHMGLPGTTMNVGMIVGIGAVSETAGLQATMERIGYDPVNEEELLYQIEEAVTAEPKMGSNFRGVDMHQNITGISLARKDLYWADKPLFQNLYANHDFNGGSESSAGHRDLHASLRSADFPLECTSILTAAFVDKVSAVSGVDVDQIQPSNPLSAYGLDSLVAVELRKWFAKAVGVDVAMFDILGSKTINALLAKAVGMIGSNRENDAKESAGAAAAEVVEARAYDGSNAIRSLSDEIAVINKPANLPMSSFQTRIWFSHNFIADKSFLNLPIISRITGKPVLANLRGAFQEMKKRNEILRTAYCEGEDYPEQIVLEDCAAEVDFEDYSLRAEPSVALNALIALLGKQELDIEEGEVMRATLVKLAETEYALVTIFHHISIDRGSSKAFLDQFMPIYDAISSGGEELQSITAPTLSYSDFAVWHNDRLLSSFMEPHIRFWKQKFKGAPMAGPLLPFAKAERPPQNDFKRAIHRSHLALPVLNRMKRICNATGTTPFQFLLAAFRSFHYRYTEEKDLTILMIDGNRPHPDLEDMLGFFVNMIPIRCSNDCDTSFDHLLTAVKDDVLEAMAHNEVPFDTIVDSIGNEKDSSCFPLGQVVINYQTHGKIPKYSTRDFEIHDLVTEDMPTACELNLEALEDDKGLGFRLEYSTTLYGKDEMARFLDNFSTFITSTVKDYRQSVSEIEMCGPKELEVLKTKFWNTAFTENHWNETSVLQMVFSNADASPGSKAIVTSDGQDISYRALINKAQKIGYALQEAGVVPGQYIGLLSRPGIEAIVAMLGILLCRCGFVPLDPDFAVERLAFMAEDSDTAIILSGKGLEEVSAQVAYKTTISPRVIDISSLEYEERMIALETASPADPFFTIYTSGSTGKPKGVVLTQSNTQQMLSTLQKDYGFCSDDKFLFSNSICFDLSIAQIFSALTSGGVVCAAASEIRKDPLQLAQFMQRVGVTFTYFTPTQFALLLDRAADTLRDCNKYRTAFFAGERLPVRMVKAFYDLGTPATIYNTWSPCELVVQTCIHKVDYPHSDNLNIPIGYPLANCRHYIVDARRQPLPAGLVGEICVGGAQVGAGYLNRPQANAKSFLEDPYCSPDDRARNWTRMFRTGDTGRFRPDGQLEFHGRIAGDKQIKLRGFRIDLGEVEHQIYLRAASDNGPKLVDLSVVARTTQNESPEFTDDRQLVAYLVPQESLDLIQKRTFVTELHKKLAQQLNSYMLPNGYQFLNNLPVTIGGKVDRQNLLNRDLDLLYPAMGSAEDAKGSSVIRDADANTLKAIIQIFKEVLKLPKSREVEASDNFFELGGQSIVVLRLQAKIKRTFKTNVSLSELFKAPTPMGVFRALTEKLQEVGLEGGKIEEKKFKWADEIRLPNESRYMVKFGTWRQSGSDISDILLVGVDSFAGLHMLASFLSANPTMTIHVLGISAPIRPGQLLQDFQQYRLLAPTLTEEALSARIRYVPGSLAEPHFGLSDGAFRRLGETIQAIFHAGTQVSLLQSYNELKRINVQAVLDVIELAGYGSRLTQINYLSTFSVPHLQTWNTSKRTHDKIIASEERASHFSPEETPDQGYFKTRWVAEMLFNQAADRGFAVSIYRASAISANTLTKVSEPADDFLRRMVQTMIESGAVPEFGTPSIEFTIDFIPVNYLASSIYHLSTHAPAKQEGPAIYHITNPHPLPLNRLPAIIGNVRPDGKRGKMVHWDTWLSMIPNRDEKEQLRWNVIREYFLKGHNMFALDSTKTLEALAAVGGADVSCPPMDAAYLRNMYQSPQAER